MPRIFLEYLFLFYYPIVDDAVVPMAWLFQRDHLHSWHEHWRVKKTTAERQNRTIGSSFGEL